MRGHRFNFRWRRSRCSRWKQIPSLTDTHRHGSVENCLSAKSFILTAILNRLICLYPLCDPIRGRTAHAELCLESGDQKKKLFINLESVRHLESSMRPASPVSFQRMSVLSVLLASFVCASLASGQTGTASTRKVSQRQSLLATAATVRPAKKNAPPPVTTDTWSGGGGSNTDWSDNSNWTNGAPSGQNVVIGPSAFSTVEDDSASIGTLTLS